MESDCESFDGEQFRGTVICKASVSVSPLYLSSLAEYISLEDPSNQVLREVSSNNTHCSKHPSGSL